MSKFQNYKISPAKFLTIANNVVHRVLLEAPRTKAKNLYKAVSEGERVSVLDVRMEDDSDVRFDLALDHSEYRGERLNFGAFRNSLTALVGSLSETLEQQGNVPVFTEERDGSLLFGIPGVTIEDGQVNALMLGVNLQGAGTVLLKLQYIDPSQFDAQAQNAG